MFFVYLKITASYMALFFALCKFTKKSKLASDYYLIIWLLVCSAFIACKLSDTLFLAVAGDVLSASFCIFLYLYVKNITNNSPFLPKDLLHFLPFAVVVCPIFFVDEFVFSILFQILKLIILVTYIVLSIIVIANYKCRVKEAYSNVADTNMYWFIILICGSLLFTINLMIKMLYPVYPVELIEVIMLFVFMNIIGVKGGFQSVEFIKQPLYFANTNAIAHANNYANANKEPYANYGLKYIDAERLSEKLTEYMKKEKPYLSQSLSLKDLAKAMDTYPHYITQVLNTIFNQNFYDFVNQYRVEEAERQLVSPLKAKFTILSIAYDCGFNSKATFNRVFKEKKGVTPTEYKLAIN